MKEMKIVHIVLLHIAFTKKKHPSLDFFFVLFIYFACNPDETVWGLSVFCQGDRARSGENGVGVLSVSEGTLQSCQSRQRKGAQSFEALEHY